VSACDDGHCITCSDEAVPMRVVELGEWAAVCADEAGTRSEVMTDLVGPVALGDVLLVHAGTALAREATAA
jgi:hydrogenase expression/formation protein HypC